MSKYFYLSFGMHLLLFCCFLSFQFKQKTNFIHSVPILSYAVSQVSSKQVDEEKKGIFQKKISAINKKFVKSEKQSENHQSDDQLLKLLHEAIFQKQIYPQEAILMHESGRVELGLVVHPDGTIDHVSVLKSSGYPIIDQAAKEAIEAISPLTAIKSYLHDEKKLFSRCCF